jgi:endonuclease-3
MKRSTALKQLKELKKDIKIMRLAAESWPKEWQILISIILSARTRDEITIAVSQKLFKKYKSISSLSNADLRNIQKIIKPVNFYKNKSKNLLNCVKILYEYYKGKPPHDFSKLIQLPGVGRKTANVFLSEIGTPAIGVDTHVSYISQYLGWTKNKEQKKIETDLEKLFSQNIWKEINPILVRFGKNYTSRKKKNNILNEIKKIN